MTHHTDLLARLDAAESRLATQAADPPPGLTDADPATGEQWDAGQAWAHVTEFVPYWQGQIVVILAGDPNTPVPFGRMTGDAGRVGAIEAGRHEPPMAQMARLHAALDGLRAYLGGLSEAEWDRVGLHPRIGDMPVGRIVDRFIVGHLEEHADQLEKLARETRPAG